jgi:acetyltransferase-like isoleucine patch superfamily enzyme
MGAPGFKDAWKQEVPGHAAIWELHEKLREETRSRWNRAVPFADELFDRWEHAQFLGFGEGTSVYNSSLILGDVQVGQNTWIGPYTVLDGRGGLTIGDWCSISAGVQIYSHDTVKWSLTAGRAHEVLSPTRIEDCVYVAPMSIVARGVTIGQRSLIGANSFVRESVPPFSIAVGTPARIVGKVELAGDDVMLVYFDAKEKAK